MCGFQVSDLLNREDIIGLRGMLLPGLRGNTIATTGTGIQLSIRVTTDHVDCCDTQLALTSRLKFCR